jgi:hypothetical protein
MAAQPIDLMRVRVEDGSSMGRSYTAKSNKRAGLGEARRKLTTKSFNMDEAGKSFCTDYGVVLVPPGCVGSLAGRLERADFNLHQRGRGAPWAPPARASSATCLPWPR